MRNHNFQTNKLTARRIIIAMKGLNYLFASFIIAFCGSLQAFQPLPRSWRTAKFQSLTPSIPLTTATTTTATALWESSSPSSSSSNNEKEEQVELGSKEYIQGMISRPVDAEVSERVSGDKVLGPTLRLAGGVTGILLALVLAFLISNGIISI